MMLSCLRKFARHHQKVKRSQFCLVNDDSTIVMLCDMTMSVCRWRTKARWRYLMQH